MRKRNFPGIPVWGLKWNIKRNDLLTERQVFLMKVFHGILIVNVPLNNGLIKKDLRDGPISYIPPSNTRLSVKWNKSKEYQKVSSFWKLQKKKNLRRSVEESFYYLWKSTSFQNLEWFLFWGFFLFLINLRSSHQLETPLKTPTKLATDHAVAAFLI